MKVSVIIPVHITDSDEIKWLDHALDSVLEQTHPDIEIVVVNDRSKPRVMVWPKRRHPQDNIVWAETADTTGVAAARNLGAFRAAGELILPLDHDDWIEKDCLQTMVEAWQNHGGVIYADLKLFGDDFQKVWKCPDYSCNAMLKDVLMWNTSLFSKADWLRVGGWNEKLSFLEDWDLNLRFIEHDICGHHINKVLAWYRQRPTSRMAKLKADSAAWTEAYARLRAGHPDFFNGRSKSMCCGGGTPAPPAQPQGLRAKNVVPTGDKVPIKYVGNRKAGFGVAGPSGVRYWVPGQGQYVEVQNGGGTGVDPKDVKTFLGMNGGHDFIQM